MQLNLFAERPLWVPPTSFPRPKGLVGLDFETRDPQLSHLGPGWAWAKGSMDERFGYPVGVALAWRQEPGPDGVVGDYWPWAHQGGGNLPRGAVTGWLREVAEDPEVHLVMANGPYDLGWLRQMGIQPANPIHDVQLQAPLLDEHRFSYSLDSLLRDKLSKSKNEDELIRALRDHGLKGKGDMWRLPSVFAGRYAQQDAVGTLELFEFQQPELIAQGLQEAYDVERRLTDVVVSMRLRGMPVNEDRANKLREECLKRESAYSAELRRLTGLALGPFDEKLGQVLQERGLPTVITKTGKISVTADLLKQSQDPVIVVVRDWRRWNKCRTTFLEGHILGHAVNGRVHCQFHQLRMDDEEGNGHGTITQRFSSSDPNLQQLSNPERDEEIGLAVRGCFVAEPGEQVGSIDYSAQEPRLITHFAALAETAATNGFLVINGKNMPIHGALEMVRRWNEDPRLDPYLPLAEQAGIKRKPAKTIYLGLAYGMGDGKLCRTLGYDTMDASFEKNGRTISYQKAGTEGQALLDVFDGSAPYVRQMRYLCQESAVKNGYVRGLDNARFRALDEREHHKMLNKLAQGSAGRQNKRGMLAIAEAGLVERLLATAHDEVVVSVGDRDSREAKIMVECMIEATKLLVPVVVDLEVQADWGLASLDAQQKLRHGLT